MKRISVWMIILATVTSVPLASAIVAEKLPSKHLSSTKEQTKDLPNDSEKQNEAKPDTQELNNLSKSAQSYKDNPSNETYSALWQAFTSWVHQLATKHTNASVLCKSSQILSKVGLKVIDVANSGGTIKIYTFSPQVIVTQNKTGINDQQTITKSGLSPLVSTSAKGNIETRDFLIESTEVSVSEPIKHGKKHSVHGRSRKVRIKTSTIHTQSFNLPASIDIKQASLFDSDKNKSLAIIGLDLQSGHYWTEGMKHISTGWVQSSEIWQQVPTFLLQTGQAKLRLSENNLVITIGSRNSADNISTGGYELVMPFIENHFALTRNETQDPARAVALQFLLAIQAKRPDLVKIWLADPQLASIPGYLGLYAPGSYSLKLINMSPSLTGAIRFRIITNTKDDLIIDISKIKGQWLVKSVYIAPADSLAREIGRILPAK